MPFIYWYCNCSSCIFIPLSEITKWWQKWSFRQTQRKQWPKTKWKGVNKTSRVLTYSLYLFKITSLTHALHNIPRYHPSDTRDHWRLLISTKDDTIGTRVPLLYRIFASIVQNKEMQHLCPCRRQDSWLNLFLI